MRAAEALTLLGFQAAFHFLFLSSFRYLSVGGQYFQPVSKPPHYSLCFAPQPNMTSFVRIFEFKGQQYSTREPPNEPYYMEITNLTAGVI